MERACTRWWRVFVVLGLTVATMGRAGSVSRGTWHERTWVVMGTYLTIRAFVPPGYDADRLLEAAAAKAREDERRFSLYREDSEVWRVNREAPNHPVKVSEPFLRLLLHARQAAGITGGAFDVTTGALTMAWGFIPGPPRVPDTEDLQRARKRMGWNEIEIDEKKGTVFFQQRGIILDFGGDAKGFSVDRMVETLQAAGVRHALVNLGGEIYAMGFEDVQHTPWRIQIRVPESAGITPVVFRIHDMAVSTSGGYERYLEVNGKRYPHILSPVTGRPVETNRYSVTVVTKKAVDADTYATALFIRGRSIENRIGDAVPCLFVFYLERSKSGRLRSVPGRRWPPVECKG